jgi:hypothetical protein
LERQDESKNPPEAPNYPKLEAIPKPHIDSFNSLFSYGNTLGLLDLAVSNIPKVVVFDGKKELELSKRNKIECTWSGF